MQIGPRGLGVSHQGRWRISRVAGIALVAVGLLLLTGVGLYYGYGIHARSQLDNLEVSFEGPTALPLEATADGFLPVRPPAPLQQAAITQVAAPSDPRPQPKSQPAETEVVPFPVSSYASVSPGFQIHPKYWDQPMWAGTDVRQDLGLPEGYRLVPASDSSVPLGSGARAQRIRIPAIGLDSEVTELRILDLGDSRAYETPKHVVGHIPVTSNPGQVGNGWFFGHLESPIKGEGDVFRKLPKIPEHLRNGDPVYVSLTSDEGEYLYQVASTRVVHEDDLSLYGSDDASITLVSCVPRLVYDHRLLVTAKLVGIKN